MGMLRCIKLGKACLSAARDHGLPLAACLRVVAPVSPLAALGAVECLSTCTAVWPAPYQTAAPAPARMMPQRHCQLLSALQHWRSASCPPALDIIARTCNRSTQIEMHMLNECAGPPENAKMDDNPLCPDHSQPL